MRFKLTPAAVGIVIASLLTGGAQAAVVLDQSFLGSPTLSGPIGQGGGPASPVITQTFAVGVSGTLSVVDASIYPLNTPSTITASIYDVIMGVLGPVPLGTISFSASALTTPSNNRPLQPARPLLQDPNVCLSKDARLSRKVRKPPIVEL